MICLVHNPTDSGQQYMASSQADFFLNGPHATFYQLANLNQNIRAWMRDVDKNAKPFQFTATPERNPSENPKSM